MEGVASEGTRDGPGSGPSRCVRLVSRTAAGRVGRRCGTPDTGPPMQRLRSIDIRALPAVLAVSGLVLPLAASGVVAWPFVAVWYAGLALAAWLLSHPAKTRDRLRRAVLGIALVPLLLLLGWGGGWWLLPADFAWVVIEIVDGDHGLGSTPARGPANSRCACPPGQGHGQPTARPVTPS